MQEKIDPIQTTPNITSISNFRNLVITLDYRAREPLETYVKELFPISTFAKFPKYLKLLIEITLNGTLEEFEEAINTEIFFSLNMERKVNSRTAYCDEMIINSLKIILLARITIGKENTEEGNKLDRKRKNLINERLRSYKKVFPEKYIEREI